MNATTDASFDELGPSSQAMYDACDRLARRPLPEPAEVDAADFEREARVYTAASKERDALSQLLQVKDNMIWTLVEERNRLAREASKSAAEVEALKAELEAARSAQPVIFAAKPASAAVAPVAEPSAAAAAPVVEPSAATSTERGNEPSAGKSVEQAAPEAVKVVLNVAE